MKSIDPSVRSIRVRLFLLLTRAFALVVLLIIVLLIAGFAYFLTYPTPYTPIERIPIVTRLETYYRVTGSWEGVETLVPASAGSDDSIWKGSVLLDREGRVLLIQGRLPARSMHAYTPSRRDFLIALRADGRPIGTLVMGPSAFPMHGGLRLAILFPVGFISIFLAILTILIGLLLSRRFVTPLAEVIAATRAVAAGNLSTRVPVSGPDDLRVLSDGFNHMAAALEQSDLERRDFLADVAHELRTPLTIIRGRLEGIVDGVYSAGKDQIAPALEETYLLERLVEDLRLLTLAERGQLAFEPRDVPLAGLAARAIELFSAEAAERGIRLSLEDHSSGALVRIDPQRTEQVIGNLIGNALRYAPAGGRVWLVVDRQGDHLLLSVNDNGPGVAEDELPLLFQRFWRAEKSRTRSTGGAGLGLAIAKQMVDSQGGSISAGNLPGGGLSVLVEFPLG